MQQQIASIAPNPTVQGGLQRQEGLGARAARWDASNTLRPGEGVAILRDKTRLVGNPEM